MEELFKELDEYMKKIASLPSPEPGTDSKVTFPICDGESARVED